MQISFLLLLITFTVTCVTANCEIKKVDVRLPVHRPEDVEDKNPNDVNVLLTTLFEMHHNLLAQISLLEDKLNTSLPAMEQSEIKHMVEHFTAQKDNIESSIQQIQSNDGLDVQNERSNAKKSSSSIETKSIPLFVNFFKRTQTPSAEQTNANTAYSLPSQPTPTFVYQAHQPNGPIEYTQHGAHQQPTNQNGQVYVSGGHQSPVYYQEQPIQQINQQFVPTPQVMNHPQVHATLIEAPYQPHYQTQHQHQPQFHQVQPQHQQQVQANRIEQELHSQINQQFQQQQQIDQQQQQQQQIQHQPQPQPQQQFDFESVFRPSSVPVRRPQIPEHDTQRQGEFGHREGIFVYYPNGVITDDKDRLTIANRFGQVFDRFGQAISNIGNRQPLNNEIVASSPRSEDLPAKNKIKRNFLKIRQKTKKPIDEKKSESKPEPEDEDETKKEINSP